jgi:hypothetical protein
MSRVCGRLTLEKWTGRDGVEKQASPLPPGDASRPQSAGTSPGRMRRGRRGQRSRTDRQRDFS